MESPKIQFKWRHHFLQIPATRQPRKMDSIVEADETYFLESFKGQRRLSRSARKRGGKAVKKGTSKQQVPVLVARNLESCLGWHRMIDHLGQNITPTLYFQVSLGKNKTVSTIYNMALRNYPNSWIILLLSIIN